MSDSLKYCDLCGVSEVEAIISGRGTELIPIATIVEDDFGTVEACPACAPVDDPIRDYLNSLTVYGDNKRPAPAGTAEEAR